MKLGSGAGRAGVRGLVTAGAGRATIGAEPAPLAAATTGAVPIEADALMAGVDAPAMTGGKAAADAGAAFGAGGGGAAAITGAAIGAGTTGVDAGRAAATGAAAPGPVVAFAVGGCDAPCKRFRSLRFLFSSATRAASA